MFYKILFSVIAILSVSLLLDIDLNGLVVGSEDGADEKTTSSSDAHIIDVRTFEEHIDNRLPGSTLMPHDRIEDLIADEEIAKDDEIKVFCRTGRRSSIAKQKLEDLGYTNVEDIGGIVDWDGPTVTSLGCLDVDYQNIGMQELASVAC